MVTSADPHCIGQVLRKLDESHPGVPLLSLGQTVFWDEPLKSSVALEVAAQGSKRKFIAGIHDTDYFAKLPKLGGKRHGFVTLAHNDTTTKGLWSAAGEFSSLFGAELVISRELLSAYGLKVARLNHADPGFLDKATEAWGWKGIVALSEFAPITAQIKFKDIAVALRGTLEQMIQDTLARLTGPELAASKRQAACLLEIFDTNAEACQEKTLCAFYESMLRGLYEFTSNQSVAIETTCTSELLKFNIATCGRPRFEILDHFLNPETRAKACAAYNNAIAGSQIFELDRFGSCALPFDVVLPGIGRGTLRVGNKGLVIMTPEPQFVTLRQPVTCACELAEALQRKFGEDVVIVGKAVTLISMLSREFIFVFHEGASAYVSFTKKLHASLGITDQYLPILRVKYNTWDDLTITEAVIELPKEFSEAFAASQIPAQEVSGSWRKVGEEQAAVLKELAQLKRPTELLAYLNAKDQAWTDKLEAYGKLNQGLGGLKADISERREERRKLLEQKRTLTLQRVALEREKGDHFRAEIFEKQPAPAALQLRADFIAQIDDLHQQERTLSHQIKVSLKEQSDRVGAPEIRGLHEQREKIEIEAETARLRLIRQGLIASRGLASSNLRPSAWWFPIVSPSGAWFKQVSKSAQAYLEPLTVSN